MPVHDHRPEKLPSAAPPPDHTHEHSGTAPPREGTTRTYKFVVLFLLACIAVAGLAPIGTANADDAAGDATTLFPVPAVPDQLHPPTPMICETGELDLNHATVAELEVGLDVSGPIAERIVAQRPFLRPQELLAVAGVGPGRLERILGAGNVCATPPSLPPPAPNPCTGDDIDLNDADQLDRIVEIFGRPTAERIVDAQPHYDLDNVVRVNGVGPGQLAKHYGELCVTPPPIDVDGPTPSGTRFAWVYSSDGGRNDLADFKLTVPAGVIDAEPGAWSEITELAVPENLPGEAFPTANFHLHAPWSNGTDVVYATVPDAGFSDAFDSTWERTLLHWDGSDRSTGEVVHGDRIHVAAETKAVTGAVTTLSPIDWAMHKANWLIEPAYGILFGIRFPGPGCPKDPWDEIPETAVWTRLGHHLRLDGDRLDLLGNEVPYGGFPIKHCVQSEGPYEVMNAQGVFRNSTGAVFLMSVISGDVTIGDDGQPASDLVEAAITAVGRGNNVIVGPGGDGTATVPPGTMGTIDMRTDMARSVMLVLGQSLLDRALERLAGDPVLGQTTAEWVTDRFRCAYNLVDAATSGSASFNTVREVGLALAECLGADDYMDFFVKVSAKLDGLVQAGTITSSQYTRYQNSLLEIREASKLLEIGGMVLGAAESLAWESSSPITLEHFAPAPGKDSAGNVYGPGCVRRAGYNWVTDEACQAAFLRSLAGETNECDASGLQCTWGGNTGGGTSTSCDPFAGSGGLQPAAPGCVLWTGGYTWCGFGQCLPWPQSALQVVELTDGRSMFVDANGGAWHMPTTGAYWSCVNRFGLFENSTQYHHAGKWYAQNLTSYRFMGDLHSC